MQIKKSEWIEYLESRVNVDVYVWGGNGQALVNLMPNLCDMEKSDHTYEQALKNTDRVLTLLKKRLLQGVNIFSICGVDCSGLAIKFLLERKVVLEDMTANALWKYITKEGHGKEIPLKDAKAGDYLFEGSDSRKWHIGYAISDRYAIESRNHDVGVVQTKISDREWKYAARPNWYDNEPVPPEPKEPVLARELYLSDPMIRGEDVKTAQILLKENGYDCGEADGIFGKKTEIATKNFQSDNGLKVDGIIGKLTGTKLGFKWEG